jgi:hypothetical protein
MGFGLEEKNMHIVGVPFDGETKARGGKSVAFLCWRADVWGARPCGRRVVEKVGFLACNVLGVLRYGLWGRVL